MPKKRTKATNTKASTNNKNNSNTVTIQITTDHLILAASLLFVLFLYFIFVIKPPKNSPQNAQAPEQRVEVQQGGQEEPKSTLHPSAIDKHEYYEKLLPQEDDAIIGPKDAAVFIVEFTDFECPFCKRIYDYPHKIQEDPQLKDKVAWVIKHFPLSFHQPAAMWEAIAVECAKEQKGIEGFIALHDKLFEKEEEATKEAILKMAEELNMFDMDKFEQCLNNEETKDKIQKDMKLAQEVGVQGTPTMYVLDTKNKKAYEVGGAVPFDTIKEIVQKILEQQ